MSKLLIIVLLIQGPIILTDKVLQRQNYWYECDMRQGLDFYGNRCK